MLQFLFFLSYYNTTVYNSKSYFKKLSYLEYGFNANAEYSINFSSVNEPMVFGLATHDEIKDIKLLRNIEQCCQGGCALSNIQYSITSDKLIKGIILYKDVLVPYCIACNTPYNFTIQLNYTNGNNHLDYRCQQLLIFIIIFAIILYIYIIFYIIYRLVCMKPNRKSPFSILLILLIMINLIQISMSFLYLRLQKSNEYFIFGDEDKYISIVRIVTNCSVFLSFTIIFCFCFMKYLKDNKKRPSCSVFSLFIIPIFCISGVVPMLYRINDIKFSISAFVLFFVFNLFVLALPPCCVLVKSGIAFYLFGILISYPLIICVLNFAKDEIPVHFAFFLSIIIFAAFLAFSMFLLLLDLLKSARSSGTATLNQQPLYTQQETENSQSLYSNVDTEQSADYPNSPYNQGTNVDSSNPYSSVY